MIVGEPITDIIQEKRQREENTARFVNSGRHFYRARVLSHKTANDCVVMLMLDATLVPVIG